MRPPLLCCLLFVGVALMAPVLAPHPPSEIFPDSLKLPPFSPGHILGTDDVGRDLGSRLLYGARVSLAIGAVAVAISLGIGGSLGAVAGLLRGRVDFFIMRLSDTLMSMPSVLLAIVIASIMGPGLLNTILAMALVSIPPFIRLARACVHREVAREYTEAARALGAGPMRILIKEILPNMKSPLMVQASFGFSDAILNASALGFLGLGVAPPTPEWGTMLADSQGHIESAPWLVALPGVCIIAVVLSFNLLGEKSQSK